LDPSLLPLIRDEMRRGPVKPIHLPGICCSGDILTRGQAMPQIEVHSTSTPFLPIGFDSLLDCLTPYKTLLLRTPTLPLCSSSGSLDTTPLGSPLELPPPRTPPVLSAPLSFPYLSALTSSYRFFLSPRLFPPPYPSPVPLIFYRPTPPSSPPSLPSPPSGILTLSCYSPCLP